MSDDQRNADVAELTATIVSAFVENNSISPNDLPSLIATVAAALKGAAAGPAAARPEELKPAVPIRRSVRPDAIICLEDGKPMKSLKRHLATHHQMTPDEYRAKWDLPRDYPMVAPDYAARRSELAKSAGLGQARRGQAKPPAKGRGRARK
jgi:predicted transcriptional regulator